MSICSLCLAKQCYELLCRGSDYSSSVAQCKRAPGASVALGNRYEISMYRGSRYLKIYINVEVVALEVPTTAVHSTRARASQGYARASACLRLGYGRGVIATAIKEIIILKM